MNKLEKNLFSNWWNRFNRQEIVNEFLPTGNVIFTFNKKYFKRKFHKIEKNYFISNLI